MTSNIFHPFHIHSRICLLAIWCIEKGIITQFSTSILTIVFFLTFSLLDITKFLSFLQKATMGLCASTPSSSEKSTEMNKSAKTTTTTTTTTTEGNDVVVVTEDKKVEPKKPEGPRPTSTPTKPVEEPKKVEEPKAEEPKKVEEPKKAEEPKAEEPKDVEETKTEEPVVAVVAPVAESGEIADCTTPEMHHDYLEKGKEYKFKGHDSNKRANELHDEGSKLKEAGDKEGYSAKVEESKPFRAEAKEHYAKSDLYQLKVSEYQARKAQESAEPSIDLHNYFLDNALECVKISFDYLAKRTTGAKTFLIITGAGNHSDPKIGVKIKPAVVKVLEEQNYEFEAANNGSYLVQLKD